MSGGNSNNSKTGKKRPREEQQADGDSAILVGGGGGGGDSPRRVDQDGDQMIDDDSARRESKRQKAGDGDGAVVKDPSTPTTEQEAAVTTTMAAERAGLPAIPSPSPPSPPTLKATSDAPALAGGAAATPPLAPPPADEAAATTKGPDTLPTPSPALVSASPSSAGTAPGEASPSSATSPGCVRSLISRYETFTQKHVVTQVATAKGNGKSKEQEEATTEEADAEDAPEEEQDGESNDEEKAVAEKEAEEAEAVVEDRGAVVGEQPHRVADDGVPADGSVDAAAPPSPVHKFRSVPWYYKLVLALAMVLFWMNAVTMGLWLEDRMGSSLDKAVLRYDLDGCASEKEYLTDGLEKVKKLADHFSDEYVMTKLEMSKAAKACDSKTKQLQFDLYRARQQQNQQRS